MTPEAEVKLVRADIRHARTRIGYIAGAGDEVPAALRQVGYDVTLLSDETIAHGSLAPYQAIVTGVRAFNVDPRLPFLHERLMKYVADGGTLVVQYNTQNFISSVPAQLGPAPFKISQERVTDENAAVTMLAPKHALVTAPNHIGERDFAGWVQERGLYFADEWDPHTCPSSRCTTRTSPSAGAASSSPSTARARSSTRASPSSGSFPPACRAPIACSPTCSTMRPDPDERPGARRCSAAGSAGTPSCWRRSAR